MKILWIGLCYSVFTQKLAKELKKWDNNLEIYGISLSPPNLNLEINMDYIYNPPINRDIFKKIEKPDLIHLHYLSPSFRYFWEDIKKLTDKIVVSIWGSDYYVEYHKANNKVKEEIKKILKECKAITFTNEIMAQQFLKSFKDLDLMKKIHICRFGLTILEYIKNLSLSKQDAMRLLVLPQNKLIITIGYSSTSGHQHMEIIREIHKLSNDLLDKLFFIFPMTYGDFEYREEVEKILHKTKFNFKILKKFMKDEEVALLRIATDIMIHLPKTDQFSGSMQEHLFAGNIVITGSWLPYKILWENGVFAIKIDKIEELSKNLISVIPKIEEFKNRSNEKNQIIWNLSSWESNIDKWIKVYEKHLNTL